MDYKKRKLIGIAVKNILLPLAGVGVFLTVWWIAAASYNIELILPTPLVTFKAAFGLLGQSDFWFRVFNSFLRTLIAFCAAFAIALIFSAAAEITLLGKALAPILAIIRALPTVVVIILFLVWTNNLITPVLVASLIIFPMLYTSFSLGFSKTEKGLKDAAKVMGANRIELLWYIHMPLMKKNLIENAASGLSLTFKLVVSAEILAATQNSIGQFMNMSQINLATAQLMASAIIVCLVCIVTEYAIRLPLMIKAAQ